MQKQEIIVFFWDSLFGGSHQKVLKQGVFESLAAFTAQIQSFFSSLSFQKNSMFFPRGIIYAIQPHKFTTKKGDISCRKEQ